MFYFPNVSQHPLCVSEEPLRCSVCVYEKKTLKNHKRERSSILMQLIGLNLKHEAARSC